MATPPPKDWPITVTRSTPNTTKEVADRVGEVAQRIVAPGLRGMAMAQEVGCDNRVVRLKKLHGRIQVRELPAIPWSSNNTGPSPARR